VDEAGSGKAAGFFSAYQGVILPQLMDKW